MITRVEKENDRRTIARKLRAEDKIAIREFLVHLSIKMRPKNPAD